jgi:hypothetical protein
VSVFSLGFFCNARRRSWAPRDAAITESPPAEEEMFVASVEFAIAVETGRSSRKGESRSNPARNGRTTTAAARPQ